MNNSVIIQRTGQLLLDGWKLLSISCPICNTALLSSRNGEMRCPGCDLPVMVESNQSQKLSTEPTLCKEIPAAKQDLDTQANPFNLDKVSSRIGEKLLKGWIMTSDACKSIDCRGTPLMQNPATGFKLCVCCERENGEYVAPDNNNKSQLTDTLDDDSITTDSYSNESAVMDLDGHNDPSKLISEKLLKGWALLDTCCPAECNGNVPLMRNLDGKTCCVVCGWHKEKEKEKEVPQIKVNDRVVEYHNVVSVSTPNKGQKEKVVNIVKKKLCGSVKELETADVDHSIKLAELICKLGNTMNVLKALEEEDFNC